MAVEVILPRIDMDMTAGKITKGSSPREIRHQGPSSV